MLVVVVVVSPFPELINGQLNMNHTQRYDVLNSKLTMTVGIGWHKCVYCHHWNPSFCELDLSSPRMSSLLGWVVKDLYELGNLS